MCLLLLGVSIATRHTVSSLFANYFQPAILHGMDKRTKVAAAIKAAGGHAQLAKLIGYSRARIYQWEQEGWEYLPELAEYRWRDARAEKETSRPG